MPKFAAARAAAARPPRDYGGARLMPAPAARPLPPPFGDFSPAAAFAAAAPPPGAQPQLVLLEFGLAEELTPDVRTHFLSFLFLIAAGDGAAAARHLLRWSTAQECADPAAFAADMATLFDRACDLRAPAGIDLDAVMKATLQLARTHGVSVDSAYASLVVGVCVITGFATALDPAVNLMDAAAPCFLAYNLTGRLLGRMRGGG
jgi:aarF domain-containing kinase